MMLFINTEKTKVITDYHFRKQNLEVFQGRYTTYLFSFVYDYLQHLYLKLNHPVLVYSGLGYH